MKRRKKNYKEEYYKDIDIIRLFACIAILFYHLNLLAGGYLAVCTFFVLSGYLSCMSAFRKEKFSLKNYYWNRILKLYLPLLVVVFITIFVVSFLPNTNWFQMKTETTSVILGYNNYWQLGASLDYFAHHINSPFMHFWYIAILLQFDLVFPILYLILRKIGDKVSKIIPCIIVTILAVSSTIYFSIMSSTNNIMLTYYATFTRIFSILFGLSLGFVSCYYGPFILPKLKDKNVSEKIFYIYLLILLLLFILVDSESPYFGISMIITTFISCRLIDYGTLIIKKKLSIFDKMVKSLSSVTYEIYLIQYPIIFLFQYSNLTSYLKIPLIIILVLFLSYFLHMALDFHKDRKYKIVKFIMFLIILISSFVGGYQYFVSKDYTKEMKELEEQLEQNQKLVQAKQEEYASKQKQEQDDWLAVLTDLENAENELKNVVNDLQVVGVGDSVMLGAVTNLYKQFPNGYFDAKVSRTAWVVNDILKDLKNKNMLGNPIILNLGANGDCSLSCKKEIIKTAGDREIFWVNVTNDKDVHVNSGLNALAEQYSNVHIVDWNSISKGHSEYFVADGIHLTGPGREAYTKAIYDAIYNEYSQKYHEKKEEIMKKHEEEMKSKISFYGNNLLLNAFDDLQDDFNNSHFNINKEYDYQVLKKDIENSIEKDSLNFKVVLAFDGSIRFGLREYQELIELCKDHEIYIVSITEDTTNTLSNMKNENVKVINFYQEIKNNSNYVMTDKIHLTKEGNEALRKVLKDTIK